MNKLILLLALTMFTCMPQKIFAQSTPPHTRGVDNQDIHKIFSTYNLLVNILFTLKSIMIQK